MAQLAIRGHATRGKEVIELLKMLGGKNNHNYGGTFNECYIIDYNEISTIYTNTAKIGDFIIFTLEEFLEKYPYKVGDKVQAKGNKVQAKGATSCGTVEVIERMQWVNNKVEYEIRPLYDYNHTGLVTVSAGDLQPYKEETMEEKDEKSVNHVFDSDTISFDIAQRDKYELDLQGNFKVVLREGKYYVERIKPKYPKTYVECCIIMKCDSNLYVDTHLYSDKLESLYKLLICRDAYWKIIGEEMCLGKPWKPDWDNDNQFKHIIVYRRNNIVQDTYTVKNCILAFPTKVMRDTFYENFKDLIEDCKIFL